jgi:hypothetical protein
MVSAAVLPRPEPLLFLSASSSFILTWMSGPHFRPTDTRKILVAPGIGPGTSGSAARESDHFHEEYELLNNFLFANNCCQLPVTACVIQSSWLQPQRSLVLFPALTDFLSSSVSGAESTQPL